MRLLPLILLSLLWLPSSAWGGGYAVTACFGPENNSWTEWEPTGGVTAYAGCPGGVVDVARPAAGAGLIVRNVVAASGHAVRGATGGLRFAAPPGTTIVGIDFDANVLMNPGWQAGVHDGSRWIWCGERCSTSVGQWVHQELRGLSTGVVQALVRCDAARCRRDARHAFVALRDVRVHLADASAPALSGVRGGLAGDGWLRGRQDVVFDAADNVGVAAGRVTLDGAVVSDEGRWCDFTRPVPCTNGVVAAAFDTRAWSDGEHVLGLGAADAAGNWSWLERRVRVDNTAPVEPAPALDGGADWSPERIRTVSFPLPPGQAAPLVRAPVRVCRAGGACHDVAPAIEPAASSSPRGSARVEAFAGPGEYTLRVALEDGAGNVGPAAPPLTLRFDDTPPGAPDVSAADRWLNGGALPLAAEGEPPPSGIRGYRVRIGGRDTLVPTSLPLDELPEGGTPIEVRAISGAGVASTAVRTLLKLDRSRPAIAAEGLPAPDAWSREPVRIGLRAHDQAGLSGVASVNWSVGGDGQEVSARGDAATFEVAADGRHAIGYRALDAAGNASERHTATVKVDRTPPETVAFEAADPADPALVRVVVADATSGVAGGRVELRGAGGDWRRVPTSYDGGRLLARIDDAALAAGRYELRAVVADAAGNEAIGTRRADGAPATVTLPLRTRTALTASVTRASRAAGRRGQRTLRARLTAGGRPLARRTVTLAQRVRGRSRWRRLCGRSVVIAAAGTAVAAAAAARCALRTDASGRVQVRLRRGPSRTVRVTFAGDPLLLPARGRATVRTRARVRLRAIPRSVPAGGTVRFAGRLLGGHVPPRGKLVELQARVGLTWRTFATVRTDRRGRFAHTHRFAATSAGSTFAIRLRVRREAAYPYERVATRPLSVRVM